MKEAQRFRSFLAVAALGFGLALGGCGGGSGDSSDSATPSAESLSGQVADGYLVGARVWLDINGNKEFDEGEEPFAITGFDGEFSIDVSNYPDPGKHPIVVETLEGTWDRDDNPGIQDMQDSATAQKIAAPFRLSAPPGKHQFVSPITTMVQRKVEKAMASGDSRTIEELVEEKAGEVQADLGQKDARLGSIDPFENYVKGKDSGDDELKKDDFEKVHMVAQAVTRTMATMRSSIEDKGLSSDIEVIVNAIVEKVMEQLSAILDDVETARAEGGDSSTYDPETVAEKVSTNVAGTEIEAALDQAQAEKDVVKSSFQELLMSNGSYWIDAWQNYNEVQFEYSRIGYDESAEVLLEEEYEYVEGGWQQMAADTDNDDYLLTEEGWVAYSDGPESYDITFNEDGTATISHKTQNLVETVSVAEFDLEGKKHLGFAGYVADYLTVPTTTFPAGGKAFKLAFTPHQDMYLFDTWIDENTGKDWNYLSYRDEFDQEQTIIILDDMLSVFAEDTGTYYLPLGESKDSVNFAIRFHADGTVHCYKVPWDYNQTPVKLDLKGTWEDKTVNDERLIQVKIPASYQKTWDIEAAPFFFSFEGVIKTGEFLAKGTPDIDKGYDFNQVAFESLRENINYDYVPTNDSETGDEGDTTLPQTIAFTTDLLDSDSYYIYWDNNEEEVFSFKSTTAATEGTLTIAWGSGNETATWSLDSQGVVTIDLDTPMTAENIGGVQLKLVENGSDFITLLFQDLDLNGNPIGSPAEETWEKSARTGSEPGALADFSDLSQEVLPIMGADPMAQMLAVTYSGQTAWDGPASYILDRTFTLEEDAGSESIFNLLAQLQQEVFFISDITDLSASQCVLPETVTIFDEATNQEITVNTAEMASISSVNGPVQLPVLGETADSYDCLLDLYPSTDPFEAQFAFTFDGTKVAAAIYTEYTAEEAGGKEGTENYAFVGRYDEISGDLGVEYISVGKGVMVIDQTEIFGGQRTFFSGNTLDHSFEVSTIGYADDYAGEWAGANPDDVAKKVFATGVSQGEGAFLVKVDRPVEIDGPLYFCLDAVTKQLATDPSQCASYETDVEQGLFWNYSDLPSTYDPSTWAMTIPSL